MDADNRERQQAEIELLSAMYPEELEDRGAGSVSVKLEDSIVAAIQLPDTYPSSSLPKVALEFGESIGNPRRKQLCDTLKEILIDLPTGTECLDELVIKLQEATKTQLAEGDSSSTLIPDDIERDDPNPTPPQPPQIKLVLIWSHHILATSKRKFIHDTSKELNLNGVCKPGYPGIIIVEGAVANVDDFVEQIKQLRWQALSVKAEMDYGMGEERKLGGDGDEGRAHVHEVENVADVTAILRPVGLEEWFLEGMGIRK